MIPRYPKYTHKRVSDEIVEVTFDNGDVVFSPVVPDWQWEVAHNYYLIVLRDQYRAREFIRPGMHVLDIGANIGCFSLLACGLGAQVVAVEPVPANVECLRLLRDRHDYPIEIVEGAAGDHAGRASLHCSFDCISGGSWIVADPASDEGEILDVGIDTVDRIVKAAGLPRVDFLKVDTEGHEHEVLRGAADLLRAFHPILAISAYHAPDDAESLPALLREITDGYANTEVLSVGEHLELEMFAWS